MVDITKHEAAALVGMYAKELQSLCEPTMTFSSGGREMIYRDDLIIERILRIAEVAEVFRQPEQPREDWGENSSMGPPGHGA